MPDLTTYSEHKLATVPLSVWLWNGLNERGVPIVCMDASHANAALKMMRRNDAIGLAQIVRTSWCKSVHVNSTESHEARAVLATRSQLVRTPCDLENQIGGILRTFGNLFGKWVGRLAKRAEASSMRRRRSQMFPGDWVQNRTDPSWNNDASITFFHG